MPESGGTSARTHGRDSAAAQWLRTRSGATLRRAGALVASGQTSAGRASPSGNRARASARNVSRTAPAVDGAIRSAPRRIQPQCQRRFPAQVSRVERGAQIGLTGFIGAVILPWRGFSQSQRTTLRNEYRVGHGRFTISVFGGNHREMHPEFGPPARDPAARWAVGTLRHSDPEACGPQEPPLQRNRQANPFPSGDFHRRKITITTGNPPRTCKKGPGTDIAACRFRRETDPRGSPTPWSGNSQGSGSYCACDAAEQRSRLPTRMRGTLPKTDSPHVRTDQTNGATSTGAETLAVVLCSVVNAVAGRRTSTGYGCETTCR